jgi:hypothetical protein
MTIQMPRRSVTRFFIPLIDVLTLLFCIFLLMPIFNKAAQEQDDSLSAGSDAGLQDLDRDRLLKRLKAAHRRLAALRRETDPLTARERDELKRFRSEQGKPLQQRYAIFVLGLDATNGELFYYDPEEPNRKVVVGTKEGAERLIERQKQEAGGREVFFLFQAPRKKSAFPIVKQRKEYDAWFRDVPHGYDRPDVGP